MFVRGLIAVGMSLALLAGSAAGQEDVTEEPVMLEDILERIDSCLLYTSPSPRDQRGSRMPSSA